ncbi:MAG: tail fiber domain-containing protein [Candidatus Pacebacteria bacterium]|nr:tail fiber domain-containing protein [Candidatus Paceibacterota bacterium]
MKKRVPFFLFVLGLCVTYGSVVFSAPAFGPGEYLDPPCAPGTTYLGDDCSVSVGWEVNPTDGFVFNMADMIGIGTDTPTVALDVVGDVHILSGIGELAINNDFDWTGDSSSFNATRAVSDNDGIENVNEFTTDITTSGAVTNTTYRGLASILTYAGDDDMLGMSSVASQPLIGILSQVENTGLGDVSLQGLLVTTSQSGDGIITGDTVGGQFVTVYSGDGSVEDFTGARFSTYNGIGVVPNSGDVDSLRGINTTTVHGSTGTTSFAYGIATNIRIENAGGLIDNAYGNDIKIIAEAGQIQQATNIKLNSLVDTGTIDNATGIEFNAGTYGGDIPGLFSTGNTIGISFQDYVAEGALEGDNVYGIYFNDSGALQGVSNEYALYIGDTDAENWFSNGLRIGVNNDTYKIDDDNDNGAASSSPLYIGNEVIDTSVSDRRLKKNISTAETSALEFIDQFDVVQFDWLTRNDRSEYGTVPFGLIAQDVADTAPVYARIPTDPDNYYSVRFGDMVPMTIKAIQEMNLKISDIQNFEDETLLSHLRDWLASATNGIERIFAGRVETNELQTDQLCVGSRCISESEFIELLDRSSVSGTLSGNDDSDESNLEDEEVIESEEFIENEEEGSSSDEETDTPQEDVENIESPESEEEIIDTPPAPEEIDDIPSEESSEGDSNEPVSE